MDGVLSLAEIFGFLLSAMVFKLASYYGTYGIGLLLQFFAFIYLWFVISETSPPNIVNFNIKDLKSFCMTLFEPVYQLAQSIVKPRPFGRRSLILIQVATYGLYWLILEEYHLRYVYLKVKFPGYTGSEYSYFMFFTTLRDWVTLTLLTPLFITCLKIHEALLSFIALGLTSVGYLFAAFSNTTWQFYGSHVNYSQFTQLDNF